MARRGRPRTRGVTERDIRLLFDGLTFDQILKVMGDEVALQLGREIDINHSSDADQVKSNILKAWIGGTSSRKPIYEFLLDKGWSILGIEIGQSPD